MKKLIKVCNMVAFIFLLSFFLKLVRDWMMYDATLNSAPFSIWVLADAVRYLMPSGFVFLLGRFRATIFSSSAVARRITALRGATTSLERI